ncbi:MAG: PH domain-containing protein [Sporichthyaceae bacterium]|nr:PH domain-containing protein [Sporichthyaceae bacterium]
MTFRPWLATWMLIGLALAVTAALGTLAVVLPGIDTRDRWGFVGLAALVVVGLSFLARPRVRADLDGLEIVNVWRRRRLGWPEVVAVRLGPGDPWLVLDLDDGTTAAAMGVQSADGVRGRRAAAQIAALVAANTVTPRDG